MSELINIIKEWPVIIQGALGSALFWLILLLGQKLNQFISKKYSFHSKRTRISYLRSKQFKYYTDIASVQEQTRGFSILTYRALRHIIKSFMWLAMGLITNSLFYPLGVIGYVGALYFLFQAYEVVSPIEENENSELELKKVTEELDKLKT